MVDYKRLQALDGAAWTDIEAEFFQRIFFYVRRFVSDFQRAEDLTQETFLNAIRAIGNYDPTYNMEQYLFGIAHNKVIDHLRKQGRSPVVFGGGDDDDDRADYFAHVAGGTGTPSKIVVEDENFRRRRKVLVRSLRALVEDYWRKQEFKKLKAVELVFLKRWKHARIADLLAIDDEKAIAGLKFRAIRSLKGLLRDRDPGRSLFLELWTEDAPTRRVVDDVPDVSPHPGREDRDFDLSVSQLWVRHRVSCPHRDLLRAHLGDGLGEGEGDYVRFHLDVIECPFCLANLEDLETSARSDREAMRSQVAEARDRSLAASSGFLTKLRESMTD